jgi:hypothetical protein
MDTYRFYRTERVRAKSYVREDVKLGGGEGEWQHYGDSVVFFTCTLRQPLPYLTKLSNPVTKAHIKTRRRWRIRRALLGITITLD